MTIIHEFSHDGSQFVIKKFEAGDVWEYRVFCDEVQIGSVSTVEKDVATDANAAGHSIDGVFATELEAAVKNAYDFQVIVV